MTCKRAQEFLAKSNVTIDEQVNASKVRFGPGDAVKLARAAKHVHVAKGKRVVHFEMRTAPPSDAELVQHLIGPSGNLRAPTMRRGDRLFVGFNADEFAPLLLK